MPYKQEAPFAVQVELTEGCNLRCSFCGVNGIRGAERTYKYMTIKTAVNVAKSIAAAGWNPRFEFAMHGEPTMHPDAPGIIAVFRQHFPKSSILMLSNGGGLVGADTCQKVMDLFGAGLNTLGLDEYEGITLVPRLLKTLDDSDFWDIMYQTTLEVYPDNPKVSPHTPQKSNVTRIVHIRPISLNETGTHATLNNHAGAGAPKNDSGMGKRCAKPFRELSVRWDGGVAICCNDWRGQLKLGNFNQDTLEQIWNNPIAEAARRKLYRGERDFGPCKGCDATSYRVGLLPDKLGKVELPKATPAQERLLTAACAQRPMARVVKRAWER